VAPIVAVTSQKAMWFASRGTGIVCLLLLTVSVVLGIVTTVRFETSQWPRFVIEGLHRNVSLLILVFIALHVVTTVMDGYVKIGYLNAVVPFHSPYRTLWLGLGTVAFDLLLALAITSVVRARLGYRVWRAVHWAAYACWPIALMHGLGTGSDARQRWMVALDVLSLVAVGAAICWRLAATWRPGSRVQLGAVAALISVPLGIGLWAFAGPLQPGWARAKRAVVAANLTAEPESAGFTGAVTGTRTSRPVAANATTVSIRGVVAGPLGLHLDLELTGRALNQGVALQVGRLKLGPIGARARWTGRVVGLAGGHVEARVADASGRLLGVTLELQIGPSGNTVTGTMSARAISAASPSGSAGG
jgi:hypothetical protein